MSLRAAISSLSLSDLLELPCSVIQSKCIVSLCSGVFWNLLSRAEHLTVISVSSARHPLPYPMECTCCLQEIRGLLFKLAEGHWMGTPSPSLKLQREMVLSTKSHNRPPC